MRLLVGAIAVLATTSAAAAPPRSPARPHLRALPIWFATVPTACEPFSTMPADAGEVFGWNQLLSLATCIQDNSVPHVTDPDELPRMLDGMERSLEPSLVVELIAIEYAPGPVQVRAAYQIGMAHVAMIARARAALVAPPDVTTSDVASAEYHALHDQLEPLLARARYTAWLSFAAIDHAVADDPDLATDSVTADMVRSARALIPVLGDDESRRPRTIVTATRDGATSGGF